MNFSTIAEVGSYEKKEAWSDSEKQKSSNRVLLIFLILSHRRHVSLEYLLDYGLESASIWKAGKVLWLDVIHLIRPTE